MHIYIYIYICIYVYRCIGVYVYRYICIIGVYKGHECIISTHVTVVISESHLL